jgi:UPF0755 protein
VLKRVLLGLVLLGLLAGAGAYWALWARPGPATEPVTIIVAQGSGLARVAADLEAVGAIPGSARTYRAMARLFGPNDPIQAGEFEIQPGMSGAAVLDLLQHGQPVRRLVTIPEGMPAVLVHERLMAVEHLTGEIAVPAEGSVLPNTYDYRRGETREAVLRRMQGAMERALDELWPQRAPNARVATREEAVILASVVQKEAGAAELRKVAGVFTNRLRIDMPLQADATVIYPVTQGRPLGRRIRQSELRAQNGYNTYAMRGMPAGPIANPGREAIAAVLDPEEHRYLYFVADGSGGHAFAETLEQHNANVQRWYAIRRARGEM